MIINKFDWCIGLIFLGLTSCTTLPKHNSSLYSEPISENLEKLIGSYEVAPATAFEIVKDLSDLDPYENKGKKDSKYFLKISAITQNEITFSFLKNDAIVFENKFPFEIKKEKYLYLKNKNVKIDKIPMLYGGIFINRNQFSLSKTGNLVWDHAEDNCWGFLILLSTGYQSKYSKFFKREE